MAPRNSLQVRVPTEPHLLGSLAGTRSEPQSIWASPKTVCNDWRALPTSCQCPAPARTFDMALGWEIRLRSPPGRGDRDGGGRKEGQNCPFQSLCKPGRKSPQRHPGPRSGPQAQEARRQRLPGSQAANAVNAGRENPEPRIWATHCLWVTPELTKLRRKPSQPSLPDGVSSGEISWSFSWSQGPSHQSGGRSVPKA